MTNMNNSTDNNSKIDLNSSKNQSIKGKLVHRDVYVCLSLFVQELIDINHIDSKKGIDLFEYLIPYSTLDNGEQYDNDEATEKIEELENEIQELEYKEEIRQGLLQGAQSDIDKLDVYRNEDGHLIGNESQFSNYSTYEGNVLMAEQDIKKYVQQIESKQELIEELENLYFDEYNEIYEYWSVSDYFADKLKEQGEIVIQEYGLNIWGRCTTGQAILLDYVISKIAYDMEILEGQSYEWNY